MKLDALKKPDWTALRAQAGQLRQHGEKLRKRLQASQALGVTVAAGQIAVDLVRREEDAYLTVRSFTLPITVEALLANPEVAGAELATQLTAHGIKEKRCAVCVPPSWALTAPTDVPDIPEDDLRSYLELRAERDFPVPPSDLRLAHSPYKLPDGTRHATLAGAPVKRLDAVERMLAKAGCRAVSISLGLDRCLALNGSSGALHFLAGREDAQAVDLVTVSGGGVAALRTLPMKGDPATLFPEVRISLGRLPNSLREIIRSAKFEGAEAAAGQLYTGLAAPLRRAGIESLLAPDTTVGRPGALAAERRLRRAPAAFEFVPPKVNPWQARFKQFDSGRRRWVILGAVGFVVLLVLIFMIRSSMESSLNREWDGMRNNVADLEAIQGKIREFRPWFDSTPVSVQIFETLAAAFPDNGEAWAKSIEISDNSKVTCTVLPQPGARMNMVEALRRQPGVSGLTVTQIRGENPVQFTLNYKWERQ